jgi:DNA-binding IclR family transcriptional regulator
MERTVNQRLRRLEPRFSPLHRFASSRLPFLDEANEVLESLKTNIGNSVALKLTTNFNRVWVKVL